MARSYVQQFAFTRGEISPGMAARADMELYYAALKECINFIPDRQGRLHRRPGTKLSGQTKNNCPAKLYPFASDQGSGFMIEATPNCFRFYSSGFPKKADEVAYEIETPWGEDAYCDLEFVQECNKMFIVHESAPPMCLERTGECEFSLETFQGVGPFGSINSDPDCKLCVGAGGAASDATEGVMQLGSGGLSVGSTHTLRVDGVDVVVEIVRVDGAGSYGIEFPAGEISSGSYECVAPNPDYDPNDEDSEEFLLGPTAQVSVSGGCVEAQGCEPFTEDMVGQKIRVLDEVGDDPANPVNTWRCITITEFVSSEKVITDWAGGELVCTDLWVMEAFQEGCYPETVWIQQDRLWFGNTAKCPNGIWGSAIGDFFDFAPTEADGSVNPDNAIESKINSGSCDGVRWMHSWGNSLMVGTAGGVHSIYGAGVNSAVQADAYGQSIQQNIPVADLRPEMVGDSVYFVDASRKKLYATRYSTQYDHMIVEDMTLTAGHIAACCICKIAYNRCPMSILWVVTDDGRLSSLTIDDVQNVRGWARHRLGGSWRNGASERDPFVVDVEVIPSVSDEGQDDVYLVVRRTVNGEDLYTVEVIGDFFECYEECGSIPEEAIYLDAALQYGAPQVQTVAVQVMQQSVSVNPAALALSYSAPAALPEGELCLRDENGWHKGTYQNGAWSPLPVQNWFGKPDAGRDYEIADDGSLSLIPELKWCEELPLADRCIYRPLSSLAREKCKKDDEASLYASPPVSELSDGDCPTVSLLEGECLQSFENGWWCGDTIVGNGTVSLSESAHVALVGYPYESRATLLPVRQNLGQNSGTTIPLTTNKAVVTVECARELEVGSGDVDREMGVYCHYEPMKFEDQEQDHVDLPATLHTGCHSQSVPATTKGGVISFRNRSPYPTIINTIERHFYGSGNA